jgi:hypothetical protein
LAVTPILLLSLPRSGSTLVQRVLASHEDVATASEPWLLLPLLLPLRGDIPSAGSWHPQIHEALEDFNRELPDGVASYERAVGETALALYQEAAAGAPYYLDKTPPYFLVIDEIVRAMPDAKLVFLWRNPLAVLSSIVETFCGGLWRPQDYPTSLFLGLSRLVDGWNRYGDRACAVRYEDLITGEPTEWRRLSSFLDLEFDPSSLERFSSVRLNGAMGDPTGTRDYATLTREPTQKWRTTIRNPVRRLWAQRYLEWIGEERLATMGYDSEQLRSELSTATMTSAGIARDTADALTSMTRDAAKARLVRGTAPSAWRAILGTANGSRER